jgi:hypothetical protein
VLDLGRTLLDLLLQVITRHAQLLLRRLAFGRHGRKHERSARRDAGESLGEQQAVVGRGARERAQVLLDEDHRDRGNDQAGNGGAELPEPERRPDQGGEDQIGEMRAAREHDQADRDQHAENRAGLVKPRPRDLPERAACEH